MPIWHILLALTACGGGKTPGDDTAAPLDVAPGPSCEGMDWPVETSYNRLLAHVVAGEADDALLEDLAAVVEMAAALPQGPWTTRLDGPYQSTDGASWTAAEDLIVEVGFSVADLAIDDDGRSVLIGVDGDLDQLLADAAAGVPMTAGMRGICGLSGLVVEGGDATPFEVTMDGDVPACVVDPDVRRLPDGRWRMHFFGLCADEVCADSLEPAAVPAPHSLYSAVSDDLAHWELEGEAASVDVQAVDPAVWCTDDDACFAWFSTGLSSTDGGRTFTDDPTITVEDEPVTPDVVSVDGGFRMATMGPGLGYAAASDDGRTFTRTADLNVSIHTLATDPDGGLRGFR